VIGIAQKFKIQNSKFKIATKSCAATSLLCAIQNSKLKEKIAQVRKEYTEAIESYKLNEALIAIWDLIEK